MPELTRRQAALILAALAAVAVLVTGVYGLIAGSHTRAVHPQARSGTATATGHSAVSLAPATALPETTDPLVYARAVAMALFDWTTTSGLLPTDYTAPVVDDADPSGEETAGLVGDVATYEPTTDQWLNLATMQVTQTLSITSATIPSDWAAIYAQSHGQLRPGTVAVTIVGVRHRTGVWDGQPAATTDPVSFTVFVACPPTFSRCHVLRLSELNNPLP